MSRGGWAALPRCDTGLSAVCDCGIFWSNSLTISDMDSYIKSKVKACDRCTRRKTIEIGQWAGLIPIESSSPMKIVCIDYLSLGPSKAGVKNILVITNHFTRCAQAIPSRTWNQTARIAARVLFALFIVHYGYPARIHSDEGQCFESNEIKEKCMIANVEMYHQT